MRSMRLKHLGRMGAVFKRLMRLGVIGESARTRMGHPSMNVEHRNPAAASRAREGMK